MKAFCFTCFLISGIYCFNIDIDNVVIIRGPEGTNFGYSAVMFNSSDRQNWILVGATAANFSNDHNITTPGNVYKCEANFSRSDQDDCIALNLRMTGLNKWPNDPNNDEDQQLLGASMAIIGDTIVTCAPLWKNRIPLREDHSGFVHTIGRCINIDSRSFIYRTREFKKNDFKMSVSESQLTYEMAQIGFSISSKKFEDNIFDILLGAPGLFNNRGGFLKYSAVKTNGTFFINYTHHELPDSIGKSISGGSLLGYSITTGSLADCPSAVVVGAPHYDSSDGINGLVIVACPDDEKNLIVKKQFLGKKSANGFATAVVFDDINGDSLDDLLVGAPLQYEKVVDEGAVYIYYGKNNTDLLTPSKQVLKGSKYQSRFGTAIQCIGDINRDGFNDVAVGAPFEDDMRGAVYFYHGGTSTLTFSQKIQASDFGSNLQSFGWYISSHHDIDNNNYPDLLIGSYMSDAVTILRSRPIIEMTSRMTVNPHVIPLNSSVLQCQQADVSPCVTLNLCFNYTGKNVPVSTVVSYNLSADVLRTESAPSQPSRVHLYIEGQSTNSSVIQGHSIQIDKDLETCAQVHAVVHTINRQFYESLDQPLVFEAIYELADVPILGKVQPILSKIPVTKITSANFSYGCDGVCHPDLHVEMSLNPNKIIFGITTELVLQVRVTNNGDQSHSTQITLETSNNTKYIGYFLPDNEITEKVFCQEDNSMNKTQLQCDVPDIMYRNQRVIFNVRFIVTKDLLLIDGQTVTDFNRFIIFTTQAESTSQDLNPANNLLTVQATVKLDSRLDLYGISSPEQIKVSKTTDQELSFRHRYTVMNRGPSPLVKGSLHICLPVVTQTGQNIMTRDELWITENSKFVSWKIITFPGVNMTNEVTTEPNEEFSSTTVQNEELSSLNMSNEEFSSTVTSNEEFSSTTTTSTLTTSPPPSRRKRETAEELVQNTENKRNSPEVSCDTIDETNRAVILVEVQSMEKDEALSFDVHFNISENSLSFTQASVLYYTSTGEIVPVNDERFIIRGGNTTRYDVSSEIFPNEVIVVPKKINIWIIIGGSIGGLVLLIVLGVVLWKCGFFRRKKREVVTKWKRQSGYYADRKSRIQSRALSSYSHLGYGDN